MKRCFVFISAIIFTFPLAACDSSDTSTLSSSVDNFEISTSSDSINLSTESFKVEKSENEQTSVTLTIGNTVLDAYLNDSVPAKSLIEQLPLTVTLNDSDNDFCGGRLGISYSESDVQNGYKNGDLTFWTPAKNFVIFVDDEEKSESIDNLVLLGHITSSQEILQMLEGTIEVTIELA
ncbi:MAG: cyclophilin-like fold protein [Ruminococcus flavefaciens]|nr:cyclophilin-like fold protein [Ruminococcus flavefaciens]MCM1060974.1 cyclophilin-like fold protein [Eubacterium sp.]